MQERAEIQRDRWGRPLLPHPETNSIEAYTRASTLSNAIENTYNLSLWQQRQVAVGLAQRPDLIARVLSSGDDKDSLNRIVTTAQEVAGSAVAANLGTSIHAFTEYADEGSLLPTGLDGRIRASVEAYRQKMTEHNVKVIATERFVANVEIHCAGTFDRIVMIDGQYYIADIKTGNEAFKYAHGAAVQMSVYSRGRLYTKEEGWGSKVSDFVDLDKALLIYLPASGEPRCEFYWVNIAKGWRMARVASAVREWWKDEVVDEFTATENASS